MLGSSLARTRLLAVPLLLSLLSEVAPVAAQTPPSYSLTFLGSAGSVSDLSEAGVVVGQVSVGGATRGYAVSKGAALQLLPLAAGDKSSWALDVNEQGVIVGATSVQTSPEFGGRAGAWNPDGMGGYVLQELGKLPGHTGSVATAVNNLGDVVGYSVTGMFRYPVWFTSPAGVMDLNPFGVFDPQSINDQRQFCDRTGRRMDLDTLTVEFLGFPPSPPNYQATLGYAINAYGAVAGTAVLTTSTSCVYQAARYVDGVGWTTLTPCSSKANAYDINDLGDVIYQAITIYGLVHLEGIGDYDPQALLASSAKDWDLLTSFSMDINSRRQIAAIATNPLTGQTGVVLLDPVWTCQADLGFGGPGTAQLMACGGSLATGTTTDLTLWGVPANGPVFLVAGLSANPTPFKGGTLVPLPLLLVAPFVAGPAGTLVVPGISGGGGPASVFVQFVRQDPGLPGGYGFSNAVQLDFLP